jgi:hypothetical protein
LRSPFMPFVFKKKISYQIFGLLLFVFMQFLQIPPLWAKSDPENKLDVSTKVGFVLGTVSVPQPNGTAVNTYAFGGVGMSFDLNRDVSENLTVFLDPNVVLDIVNDQMTRQGVNLGLAYHLFGGSKSVIESYEYKTQTIQSPYNFSVLVAGGLANYGASDKEDKASIKGSIFEITSGLQFRKDLTDYSIGAEASFTLFSFPSSVERITHQGEEFYIFWRFLI